MRGYRLSFLQGASHGYNSESWQLPLPGLPGNFFQQVIKAIGIRVLGDNLTQARQANAINLSTAFQFFQATPDFRSIITGHNQIAEHKANAAGVVTDCERIGTEQLVDTPSKHGLRLFDRVQVNRETVTLVSFIDLAEWQSSNNMRLVSIGELIVRIILAKISIVDLHRPESRQLTHEAFQITSTLRVARVICTSEAESILAHVFFNRIMYGRLAGERKKIHMFVPQGGLVTMNAIYVSSEHEIE
ncbi:hypothetical protein D9M71_414130 [compost metagenome]